MNKLLHFLVLFAVSAFGANQERIRLEITITNAPVTSNTLVVNASTRTWTNSTTTTTIATNLTSVNAAATNLFNQISFAPYGGGIQPRWLNTNQIELRGPIGGALAASLSGTWATLTLVTQAAPATFTALWPLENIAEATNRTNQGSAFVAGLSAYSTNAFGTNSTALSNHITKGASPRQHIASELEVSSLFTRRGTLTNVTLINGTNNGYVGAITNGIWTNGIALSLTVTNLRSPGTGLLSEKLGTSSTASGDYTIAFGNGAAATAEASSAGGFSSIAGAYGATVWGSTAEANNIFGSAFGYAAIAGYSNTTAVGANSAGTTTNQIRLGTASETVSAPGNLEVAGKSQFGTVTNGIYTGTNDWNGDISFQRRANSSPVNGDNSGVILGTNVTISITGPTTIGAYCGFASERGDSFHFIRFSGAITNIIRNQSGLEATAGNRIITGTGGDLSLTNEPSWIQLIRNGTSSRWEVIAHSR